MSKNSSLGKLIDFNKQVNELECKFANQSTFRDVAANQDVVTTNEDIKSATQKDGTFR